MMRLLAPILLILLGPIPLEAQGSSVTIFSNGQVLVRESWKLQLPAGISQQVIPAREMEYQSLTSMEPGVHFTRVNSTPGFSETVLLRNSIGKTIDYLLPTTAGAPALLRSARLLGLDPERWLVQTDSGPRMVFNRPGNLQWPVGSAEIPGISVTMESDRPRSEVPVLYQTGGAAWSVRYRFFVGGKGGKLEASALIRNGSLDLQSAEIQLLAGETRSPLLSPQLLKQAGNFLAVADAPSAALTPAEEGVGDIHLYTLPERVDLRPGTTVALPLFASIAAVPELEYQVRNANRYPRFNDLNAEQDGGLDLPVETYWKLVRKRGTQIGDLPLPAGEVDLYQPDQAGRVQLIGQGRIGHVAPGKDFVVQAGSAFDLTTRIARTEYSTERSANRTIVTSTFKVELNNAKDSAVIIRVLEERGGEWSLLSSSIPAERSTSTLTSFAVPVPAGGKAVLTYRIREVQ